MDHEEVERDHLVQLYLLGKLTPAETARFEEHYLDCPECLAGLRQAESLHRGLRGLVARGEAEDFRPRRAGLFAAVAPFRRTLAAGLCAAALLPAAYLAWQNRRLSAELAAAREGGGGPAPSPAIAAAPTTPPAAAAGSASEVERLERELAAAREERRRLATLLAEGRAPQPGAVLAFLGAVRDDGVAPPAAEVRVGPRASSVVLVLDLGAPEGARHRLRLVRSGGNRPLWSGADVAAGAEGELTLAVPAALLPPGDYALHAEAAADGGSRGGVFPFRVVPAR